MPKMIYWILWLAFLLYSAFLAPANGPSTKPTGLYVKQLMFGPFDDIDAYVISLFYFMGIWPMIYLTILLVDGQYQRLNGTFAALLSNLLGAWAILPYFALRRSEKAKDYRSNIFIRIFESKIVPIFLILATLGLIGFALLYGDIRVFFHEFQTNFFIHVMTIDFCILSSIFPFLIEDDLKRRSTSDHQQWAFYFRLCFLPLLGPLIYFYLREPLKSAKD